MTLITILGCELLGYKQQDHISVNFGLLVFFVVKLGLDWGHWAGAVRKGGPH